MGVNHVNFANGENVIDLRGITVSPETLLKGITALNSKGEPITGIFENAISDGYIKPSGSVNINSNGTHNVRAYENAVVSVPTGVFPTGNLTDALITRSSSGNGHSATIPMGYYVDSDITISEWKSGQISGSGSAGGSFTIPYSSIGFIPSVALLIYNNASFTTNMVWAYFALRSGGARSLYVKGSLNTHSAGTTDATFDSNGVTFPAPTSSIKYHSNNYRWCALR